MSNHTPAPWHRNIKCAGKYPTVFAGRNQHVAVVKQQATPEETEANIDMVTASPLMYDALETALLSSGYGIDAPLPTGEDFFKVPTWVFQARHAMKIARGIYD